MFADLKTRFLRISLVFGLLSGVYGIIFCKKKIRFFSTGKKQLGFFSLLDYGNRENEPKEKAG